MGNKAAEWPVVVVTVPLLSTAAVGGLLWLVVVAVPACGWVEADAELPRMGEGVLLECSVRWSPSSLTGVWDVDFLLFFFFVLLGLLLLLGVWWVDGVVPCSHHMFHPNPSHITPSKTPPPQKQHTLLVLQ